MGQACSSTEPAMPATAAVDNVKIQLVAKPPAGKLNLMWQSPPCRAVMYLIEHDQLPVEYNVVDLMKGEHMTPDNLKENPKHSIPWYFEASTGVAINDSSAILKYLASLHKSALYPTDLAAQAKVDEMTLWASSTVYRSTAYQYIYPQLGWGINTKTEYDSSKTEDVMKTLEAFLSATPFIAGQTLSTADFQLFATLSTSQWVAKGAKWEAAIEWKLNAELPKYPALQKWYNGMAALPCVIAAHAKGFDGFCGYMASME